MTKVNSKKKNNSSINIPSFVRGVVERLHAFGFKAYIVGGAIRDIHLQRTVKDWDIATSASSEEIQSLFHDIKNFSLKHETVTLVHNGQHFEVTSFKGTKKQSSNIEDDLSYRDFTINAMAYDIRSREFIDPYGGKSDISGKLVNAVGNPEMRFKEDPLRLLRGVRISIELNFDIKKDTMETISRMSNEISSVAPERVRDELMKILLCSKPSEGFSIMRRSGLLVHVLPELMEGFMMQQNSFHRYTVFRHIMETVDKVQPDPVLRLAALFHDIGKPQVRTRKEDGYHFYGHEKTSATIGEKVMERLRFSKEMINKVSHLVSLHEIYYDNKWSDGAVRRLIRRAGKDNISGLLSLRRADLVAHGNIDDKLDLLTELENRMARLMLEVPTNRIEDLSINGERVMEILEIGQGPCVGKVLKKLMEEVTDNPEINTIEQLTNLLIKWKTEERDVKK